MRSKKDCLHSIEVQIRLVAARSYTGSCPPSHADAVSGASDFDDQHSNLRRTLFKVLVVYLAQAATAIMPQ